MTLEIIVSMLAVLGYLVGSYADERRSRQHHVPGYDGRFNRRLHRLRDQETARPRMPMPSSP